MTHTEISKARRIRAPKRLLVAIAAAACLLLAIGAALDIWLGRQKEIETAESGLSRLSLTLAEAVSRNMQGLDLLVASLRERVVSSGAVTPADLREKFGTLEFNNFLRDRIRDIPQIDALAIQDQTGQVVNFTRAWPVPLEFVMSDRDYFIAHRDRKATGFFIGKPVVNRLSGEWTFFLSRRIDGPNGEFLGVALGVIESSYFGDFFKSVIRGTDATISLFRHDGVLLARHPSSDAVIGRSFGSQPMFREVMAGSDHGIIHTPASTFDGIARIIAPRAVRNYPLVISITNTNDAILADWRKESRIFAVGTAGTILLIMLCAVLLGRYIEFQMRMAGSQAEKEEARRAEQQIRALNRALHLLSRCNGALIRISDEPSLLTEICQIAVDVGGYRTAWVGYAQQDEAKSVRPMAHAGEAQGYFDGLKVSWSDRDPHGLGPSGRAIRTGVPIVVEDLATDPLLAPWREQTARHGFRSMVCLPLNDGTDVLGSMALYAGEVRSIASEEMSLLKELAQNLAFGIAAIRLRERHKRVEAAVTKMAAGVSAATGTSFFEQLVRNMAEALGAAGGFITRVVPGEPVRGCTVAAVVDGVMLDNFGYEIGGTPCENLMQEPECVVRDRVAALYPGSQILTALGARGYVGRRLDNAAGEPMGMLLVLYRDPLEKGDFIVSTLRIFAARAAAELERREADTKLREQASLIDKAKDAIIVRTLDHRVLFWNKGAERLYGWTAEEATGRSVEDLVYPDPAPFRTAIMRVVANGEWSGDLVQRRKDGSLLTAEANWTLVCDEHGRAQSILSINTDITGRRATERQLQQSQRLEAVGQLTGGVAHDFNNLLTVILGNAEMLADDVCDEDERRELVETTRDAALRGAELTHRLLAFARLQTLAPRSVQANDLVAGMQALLRRVLSEDIDITIRGAPDLAEARVDPSELEGALLNLCLNARDAMPGGGTLIIETANATLDADYAEGHPDVRPGAYVMVAVSDTGTGIAPDHLRRVFDPFFTTKEVGKGTGLGLSMVYGFLKQSDGHVNVYSELGRGTTVSMYLPVADAPGAVAAATPAVIPYGASERILVVEDDDLVRRHSVRQLEQLGYEVLSASNGPEALDLLRRDPTAIDLLFTDMVMPGAMNGRQLAAAVLAIRPALKVLYTSGYTEHAVAAQDMLDEPIPLLKKPYRREELARSVRAVLAGG